MQLKNFLGHTFKPLFIFIFMSVGSMAHARVFSYADSWASGYIRGTGGFSSLDNDAYADTSGTSTNFKNRDKVNYNFSGEFGFAFRLSEKLEWFFGLEGHQGKTATAAGNNAAGTTKYMDVTSSASAFIPNVKVAYVFLNNGASKIYAFGGVGYATVKVQNDYSNAGNVIYGGPTSYSEAWKTTAISYEAGVGLEYPVLDNVTFSLVGGWRILNATNFKLDSDTTTVRGGSSVALTSGSAIKDNNGNDVTLDLGGPYAGVIFRFYIPPMN